MNSTMGWIVGGIIVLVVALFIGWLVLFPQPSDPSSDTTAPGAMDYRDVGLPVTTIVPAEPSGPGNAGDDYKKAVDIVAPIFEEVRSKGNDMKPQTILDRLSEDLTSWLPQEGKQPDCKPVDQDCVKLLERIVACVADGASKKEMKYPFDLSKMEVAFRVPESKYLSLVSQAMHDYAYYQFYVLKKPELAEKTIHTRLIFGWHVSGGLDKDGKPVGNRVYPYVTMKGLEIQMSCCEQLKDIYKQWPGHEGKIEALDRYSLAANDAYKWFAQKKKFLMDKFVREQDQPNPGDIYNVIQNDKDPCWRVQGIFALGMLEYSPALEGSQNYRGDKRMKDKLAKDKLEGGTDLEKAAMKAASTYKIEDYRNCATKNEDY